MKRGIIIGAGIGGLTTAIALGQKGIETTVFEQAWEMNEVGAGIWVAPNGLKVFDKLGLANEIIKHGKMLDKITVADLKNKPISVIDGKKIEARHGFKTLAIHRATLQKMLAKQLQNDQIVLNKRFKSYTQNDDKVLAEFEDGSKVEADFLIIADGIKSKGRLQINNTLGLRFSKQTCWRFVADFNLPADQDDDMFEIWGDKKGSRVGYSMINSGQVYVYITNCEKAGGRDNSQTVKRDLLKLCDEFPDVVKQMILAANAEEIIRTDLYDFKPISNWIDKNVGLLGDAAHATTPNLGQGACQAIEDAFIISEQLYANESVETGFKNYQNKRIKKATFITNTSWLFAQMTNTSGLTKLLVKTILRTTPNWINEKQLDKIYSIE